MNKKKTEFMFDSRVQMEQISHLSKRFTNRKTNEHAGQTLVRKKRLYITICRTKGFETWRFPVTTLTNDIDVAQLGKGNFEIPKEELRDIYWELLY